MNITVLITQWILRLDLQNNKYTYMKKLYFSLILLISSISFNAQIVEDFETASPTGWTFMETSADDPGWVQSSLRANSGLSPVMKEGASSGILGYEFK